MANFFLRDIDVNVFREARAACVSDGKRLVEVINELLRDWLKQRKLNG